MIWFGWRPKAATNSFSCRGVRDVGSIIATHDPLRPEDLRLVGSGQVNVPKLVVLGDVETQIARLQGLGR
jgi:hypothetical protein